MISRSFAILEGRRETGGLRFFRKTDGTGPVAADSGRVDKDLSASKELIDMRRSAFIDVAFVLSAVVALAACGGGGEANNLAATETDSNVMFDGIGNDASALEAAANASPLPPANEAGPDGNNAIENGAAVEGTDSDQPVLGETKGGDTGGNVIQGNNSGT